MCHNTEPTVAYFVMCGRFRHIYVTKHNNIMQVTNEYKKIITETIKIIIPQVLLR